jgi:hypothetical protein
MKKIIGTGFLLLVLVMSSQTLLADSTMEQLAVEAAETWLGLIDKGRYGEGWAQAAGYFKAAVAEEQWQKLMIAFREPLGKAQSRIRISAQYTEFLPGAPDGEYVVIQYQSSFENKVSAVETITPMLDEDGVWRVSGYYIK